MPRIKGSGDYSIRETPDGRYLVRCSFTDSASGKRRDIRRTVKTKTAAEKELRRIIADAERNDGRLLSHERKTFADLVAHYREHKARPVTYVNEKKTSGLRSLRTVLGQLDMLERYFGKLRLRAITATTLQTFRDDRFRTPAGTVRCPECKGKGRTDSAVCARCEGRRQVARKIQRQRSIATVNRELALLRRMLNVAVQLDWIERNPFAKTDGLISVSNENKRERTLSVEEERRLLEVASTMPSGDKLRAIIVCALDTGMRQGEILSLLWSDVNMKSGEIEIRAFNTKTMQRRAARMTPRLMRELQLLAKDAEADGLVFSAGRDFGGNVKRSWSKARDKAGLPDVRFHDLRHTAASRLVAGHLPLAEVGRVLGHTQPQTTYRYSNATAETLTKAADILELFGRAADAETGS